MAAKMNARWPSIFTGAWPCDPNDWLREFKACARANEWKEDKLLKIIGAFLTEQASIWYEEAQPFATFHPTDASDDNLFKMAFLKQHRTPGLISTWEWLM